MHAGYVKRKYVNAVGHYEYKSASKTMMYNNNYRGEGTAVLLISKAKFKLALISYAFYEIFSRHFGAIRFLALFVGGTKT